MWGRVMHICIGKLIIIGSDNGLSPGRRQAIIWTNAGIWLMGPLGTNFSVWIFTATRVYKPDGFNPFCHDCVHIVYVYIPTLLYLPYVCIFYVYPIMTKKKKLQWNINRNSYIFIQENALENVVCEMTSILSWPQCAKQYGDTLEFQITAYACLFILIFLPVYTHSI